MKLRVSDKHGCVSATNHRWRWTPRSDRMESFFLAETLKYLWLLFEDDDAVLPLERLLDASDAKARVLAAAALRVLGAPPPSVLTYPASAP